jgi:hypothetical protein
MPASDVNRFRCKKDDSRKPKAGAHELGVSGGSGITGVPRSQETAFSQDSTVGLCLWPCGSPRGAAVSCERGAPVPSSIQAYLCEQ